MTVLWLVNIVLPEVSRLLNEQSVPYGGWLINSSESLSKLKKCELIIASPHKSINEYTIISGEKIKYVLFESVKLRRGASIRSRNIFENILEEIKPDIVHIYGTEYPHTWDMVRACKRCQIKYVISIQGLVSVYVNHFMANIPMNIQKRFTIRDILKRENINIQKINFEKRGRLEVNSLKESQYVIGRTNWDRACVMNINKDVEYFHCNEILRKEFYKHQWSIEKCKRYSIFASQGSYPIKGLHILLEALKSVIKDFPETRLYVAGPDITNFSKYMGVFKLSSYGRYINKLIKKWGLGKNIEFTGLLNEKEMSERYLRSHIFICSSSIENSPNSLGEAMLLGVPSIASYVGGIPDMFKDKEDGFLYQFDAPYMLAYYIKKIFNNDEMARKFSHNSRQHALSTHSVETNTNTLWNTYNEILNRE